MLESLKKEVYEANMELFKKGLVLYTWGNASGIDREKNLIVIKPSGVKYKDLKEEMMIVVDLDGNVIEGNLKPSSDTMTHVEMYKKYGEIGGIVHTHSTWATIFAQAGVEVQAFGTTHADYFYGAIPCTRTLTLDEINKEYEKNTGKVINETIGDKNPMKIPAILVKEHAPFVWGKNAKEAVYHSVVLEQICKMAYHTMVLNHVKNVDRIQQNLLDKHYFRKHGSNAYYGQNNK